MVFIPYYTPFVPSLSLYDTHARYLSFTEYYLEKGAMHQKMRMIS